MEVKLDRTVLHEIYIRKETLLVSFIFGISKFSLVARAT